MLYPYRFLENHRIYGLHENIEYFFKQVFDLNIPNFDKKTHLKQEFIPIAEESRSRFIDFFEKIVEIYYSLPKGDKEIIQTAFENNINIEKLCSTEKRGIKYTQLPLQIQDVLQRFFTNLWDRYPLNAKVEENYGTIKEHYDDFMNREHQSIILCPFCGLFPIKPPKAKYRSAYDHFIPKGLYPFVSINFKNLVPACNDCNTDEKKATDTIFDDNGVPRVIQYPFSKTPSTLIEVFIICQETYNVDTCETSLSSLSNWTVTITTNITSSNVIDSWNIVYNISRRYKEWIGHFERVWWQFLLKEYKKFFKKNNSFSEFQQSIESMFDDILGQQMAIIQKAYYKFLFETPDFESLLEDTVSGS